MMGRAAQRETTTGGGGTREVQTWKTQCSADKQWWGEAAAALLGTPRPEKNSGFKSDEQISLLASTLKQPGQLWWPLAPLSIAVNLK